MSWLSKVSSVSLRSERVTHCLTSILREIFSLFFDQEKRKEGMVYDARSGEVLAEAETINTANTRPQGESKGGRRSDAIFHNHNLRILAARSSNKYMESSY